MLQLGYLSDQPVYLVPSAKFFYCRYCFELDKCKKYHRRGLFFRVNIFLDTTLIKQFVFGEGEFEGVPEFFRDFDFGEEIRVGMSGCVKRKNSYTTCGGWTSITLTEVPLNTELQSVEMSQKELVVFSRLVKDNIWLILSLLKNYGLDRFRFSEEYSYLYPLFKIWKRDRYINLPYGAILKEIPFTFQSELDFHPFKVKLRKKSRYEWNDWGGFVRFENCYFNENMNRKTLYVEVAFRRVIGYEVYMDYNHSRCEIDFQNLSIYHLFNERLGDLLFLKDSELSPATHEHIKKLEVLKGNIKMENGKLIVEGDKEIIIYHPEHGILKLLPGKYSIYQVPYVIRGHD